MSDLPNVIRDAINRAEPVVINDEGRAVAVLCPLNAPVASQVLDAMNESLRRAHGLEGSTRRTRKERKLRAAERERVAARMRAQAKAERRAEHERNVMRKATPTIMRATYMSPPEIPEVFRNARS